MGVPARGEAGPLTQPSPGALSPHRMLGPARHMSAEEDEETRALTSAGACVRGEAVRCWGWGGAQVAAVHLSHPAGRGRGKGTAI